MSAQTSFCPKNISFYDIWVDDSVNHCFFDATSSSIIAGYILLFGIAQIIIYRKYATRIESRRLRTSFFYILQMFLMIVMPVLSIVRLILRYKIYDTHDIYGYMVSDVLQNN